MKWRAQMEPDGDGTIDAGGNFTPAKKRTRVIEPINRIWVYICPNDPSHYYAASGWAPDNDTLLESQRRRTQDGKSEEISARINCPHCKVARVPHLVKELIPFDNVGVKTAKSRTLPTGSGAV